MIMSVMGSYYVVISPIFLTRKEFKRKRSKQYIKNALAEGEVIAGEV